MDDLAHDVPFNHRKRKAESDDPTDSSPVDNTPPSLNVSQSVPAAVTCPTAPRQTCLASDTTMWPSPTSPQVSSPLSSHRYPSNPAKRPRLERIDTAWRAPNRQPPRKSPLKTAAPSKPPPTVRHGNDIEDIGIVSTSDPGPSSGSLLHLRPGPKFSADPSSPVVPSIPIDTNSIHIPSLHPLINRQTLKELDLDAILRNPQLRHDLLFDPGLQFRPTCSRRKRDMSEKYWAAIGQEVDTGCTCVSFDLHGKPHPVLCACTQIPSPPSSPVVAYASPPNAFTLRMPSRIRALLSEFLEVLLLVIQPLSSISGMYVNPNTFKSQMEEHAAQAAHIRTIFDPALIEQELRHELFDPSGLFRAIGATLKGHCAPMRDRAVEAMVQAAQACAPGGTGSKLEAVTAVRMCMEILELMKLDIANHQLQTLRPFLIRTSGQFELKTFKNRKTGNSSIQITREWLHLAHYDLLARGPIPHPQYPEQLQYDTLPRNQQVYLAVLKGTLNLIFDPPVPPSSSVSPPLTPVSPVRTPTSPVLHGYPETSYLDSARLTLLTSDAADATALSMFLLLYRQLVFSDSNEAPPSPQDPKVEEEDLLRLKNEIRDIGSGRLGHCFMSKPSFDGVASPQGSRSDRKEAERWRIAKQDIVLQIAKRAKEARNRAHSLPPSPSSPVADAPDEQMLSLAQRWADSNMQPNSPLSTMLRRRLRDVVFNAVVTLAYPGRDSTTGKLTNIDFHSPTQADSALEIPLGAATGMEPLTDEIRTLAERISRLALIHLNAFLPLYEQEGFLDRQ
ncbi:T-complex protein 11-domain-containing protein [Collybia nuda]|uniref:T-complex protein 11-domain-containing protein n=1 Tax=Collybia nuda TaxID=64659 RepID=A0A9P5YH55_9AGAR|nr:T-complex protein 11-domain-containing protein [Collybia nuda]